jgi:two-component system, OmpR family, phosphate regulon response regulator PhoB
LRLRDGVRGGNVETVERMLRILVVAHDESPISPLVARIGTEGYTVGVLEDKPSRDLIDRQWPFDLIVANWDAPEIPPLVFSLVRSPHVRGHKNVALVVFVGCVGEGDVPNIPVGVHQRIMHPLALDDLLDRVRDLVTLARPGNVADHIAAGDIRLDRKSQIAFRGKRRLNLPAIPFRALDALMSDAGRVFTRRGLAQAIWGPGADVDERTIDVEIGRIRRALNRGRDVDPIRTVRGAGYAFDERYGIGERPPGSTNLKRRAVRRILSAS